MKNTAPDNWRRGLITRSITTAKESGIRAEETLSRIAQSTGMTLEKLRGLLAVREPETGIPEHSDRARAWRMALGYAQIGSQFSHSEQRTRGILDTHCAQVGVEISALKVFAEKNPYMTMLADDIFSLERYISEQEISGLEFGAAVAPI